MYSCFALMLLLATSLIAQTGKSSPPVSKVFAVLTKSLDSKIAKADDEVNLRTLNDVVVDGVVAIPSGSRLIAHISDTRDKAKSAPQSELAIVIDQAITKEERKIPLQAIIAAIAAPQDDSLSSDATYEMMHSTPRRSASGYHHRKQKECEAIKRNADAFANGAAASAEVSRDECLERALCRDGKEPAHDQWRACDHL